jgi:EmrB/QacA subfamily drug resistance transporter
MVNPNSNETVMPKNEINKNLALFFLCMANVLVPFMSSAINLALPQIGDSLSMGMVSQSWISAIYLISTAIFQVPFARLGDIFGRKKIFILGLALFSISTIACGLSPSGLTLIILRALSGVGSAMLFGTNMAILVSIFPPQSRGKAIGINTATVYFALASGPFLGGLITQNLSWHWVFFIIGFLGIIVTACSLFTFKTEWAESKGSRFDYLGSLIYAAGLFGLIFGFTQLPAPLGFVLLALGMASLVGFIFYELKNKQPVFDVRIFKGNKVFGLSCLSALINYASTSAVGFMMSLYLQYVRGFPPQTAGLMLIIQAIVQCIVSLYAGRLSDKINPSTLATIGMGIIVVDLVGLIFISSETSMYLIAVLLFVMGLGFGLFSSPNSNVIMSSVEKKYYGQASATMGTMRNAGQALSMGIATMTIALFVGNNAITPDLFLHFMKSFRLTFIVCVVLCVAGTYASSFRMKK